jgi:alkylated DNA repair dioxygenase AlkB
MGSIIFIILLKLKYHRFNIKMIKGLTYIDDFITDEEESILISEINKQQWNSTLKRRTQHYGYNYSYGLYAKLEKVEEIPDFLTELKLKIEFDTNNKFDQCIINEYTPGQGISAHIDHTQLFSNVIVSVSLGSNAKMIFSKGESSETLILQKKSILIMQNEARYEWKHCIPALKSNIKGTRISITFRKVNQV